MIPDPAAAAVPLYVDGRFWGQLWFATDHGEPPFEARDTETLMAVATLMGGVVVQADSLKDVDRMALEDALTGVGPRPASAGSAATSSASCSPCCTDVGARGLLRDVLGRLRASGGPTVSMARPDEGVLAAP